VSRCPKAFEHTCSLEQKRPRAHGGRVLRLAVHPGEERDHRLVIHFFPRSVAARHENDIGLGAAFEVVLGDDLESLGALHQSRFLSDSECAHLARGHHAGHREYFPWADEIQLLNPFEQDKRNGLRHRTPP
jgi:hypothetical protein